MEKCRPRKSPWKILLVDDHAIVLHGLTLLINQEQDLTVCGTASSAGDALTLIGASKPDAALIDITLPGINGIELTKSIRELHPRLPVLILSMHDESLYAERAFRAGARGYVMKHEAPEMVLHAIRKVIGGDRYISDRLSSQLVRDMFDGRKKTEPCKFGVDTLSDRELEVFDLVGCGHSTRAIAQRLKLSVKTIETHRAHIKQKLNIEDASELVHRAFLWASTSAQR